MPALPIATHEASTHEVKVLPPRMAARLTVILPVYNEAATLPATIACVRDFAAQRPDCRFLIVSDGSTDGSAALLAAALPEHTPAPAGGVSFLAYPDNRGKGAAIVHAMAAVDTDLVCFMDGDMAYGLDHLDEVTGALAEADVVIGARHESPEERRNTRKFRRFSGWCFNALVRIGLNLPYQDTQAGLKGFRLPAARLIFPRLTLKGFAFDVELLYVASLHALKVVEIPARVARSHRKKPSNVSMTREPLRMARDLAQIRWNDMRGRYD